jgi:hypothetical protein
MQISRSLIVCFSLTCGATVLACSSDSDDDVGADAGASGSGNGGSNGDSDSGLAGNGGSANGGSGNGNSGTTGNDAGVQDLDAGADSAAGDSDDAGNTQQIPDGEYLQYSGTIDGEAVAVTCTRDVDPTALDYVGVTLAGLQINVFCPGNTGAYVVNGGLGFSLDNINNLDGDFTDDAPKELTYRAAGGTKAVFVSSDNVVTTEIVGNYDPATRALTGSFTAEWGAPQGMYDVEASLTGTFSVVVPE